MNLRARQYEPAMNRFGQKDVVRGQVTSPLSLNRYTYCANSPIMHIDPSGESVLNAIGNWWNKAKQTTVGSFINKVVVQPVKSAAKAAKAVVSPIVNVVTKAWNNTVPIIAQMWQEMAAVDESRPTCKVERQIIQERACAKLAGDAKRANELSALLANVSRYTANEWRFLVSDIFSENNPASEDYIDIGIRMAILERLKENGGFISPEELVEVGLYSANTTALTKQMGSGFIEMSYRLTQQGDSFWSMNLQVEEQRTGQLYSLINYMAFMYVSDYNDAFRSSGNAIRMDGATVAAPGYESSPSDSLPFDYTGTRYDINISNQTMYQLGSHFNSHGKPEMGYASKKEYQQAAYEFALEARKASDTKIYIGTWNGRGNLNNTQQIIMQRDGKSIIINSKTGQIIDFYVGTDNLGFINIIEWR